MAGKKASKKKESSGVVGFLMGATLIVALTTGAMVWFCGNKVAKRATQMAVEANQKVLEVQPLIPKGKIASASWRGKDAVVGEPDIDTGESMLDSEDPFEDREKKNKAAESLRKAIDRIHGLAVYVAPAKEDDD